MYTKLQQSCVGWCVWWSVLLRIRSSNLCLPLDQLSCMLPHWVLDFNPQGSQLLFWTVDPSRSSACQELELHPSSQELWPLADWQGSSLVSPPSRLWRLQSWLLSMTTSTIQGREERDNRFVGVLSMFWGALVYLAAVDRRRFGTRHSLPCICVHVGEQTLENKQALSLWKYSLRSLEYLSSSIRGEAWAWVQVITISTIFTVLMFSKAVISISVFHMPN